MTQDGPFDPLNIQNYFTQNPNHPRALTLRGGSLLTYLQVPSFNGDCGTVSFTRRRAPGGSANLRVPVAHLLVSVVVVGKFLASCHVDVGAPIADADAA